MAKYIIKESELRSAIEKIVAEEIAMNEGLGHALGSALKNSLGVATKAVLAPNMLAQDAIEKTHGILSGEDTITRTVSNFFGGDSGKGGSGGSGKGKRTKAEKQRERLSAGRGISSEYGRPETYPGLGRRTRLDKKSEIVAPSQSTVEWGSFGRHYHDEGDRMWNRKVLDTENALIRASRGDAVRQAKLQRRYKRILVDWLKDRDRDYEIYIKSIN